MFEAVLRGSYLFQRPFQGHLSFLNKAFTEKSSDIRRLSLIKADLKAV